MQLPLVQDLKCEKIGAKLSHCARGGFDLEMSGENPSQRSPSFSVPLVLLGFVSYSFLNFSEVFVTRLGCGCAPGFNTNSLTMSVGAIGVLLVALDVANAFSCRGWQVQCLQTGATFGVMLPVWLIFVSVNSWM